LAGFGCFVGFPRDTKLSGISNASGRPIHLRLSAIEVNEHN